MSNVSEKGKGKRISAKKVAVFLGLAMLTALLAACGGNSNNGAGPSPSAVASGPAASGAAESSPAAEEKKLTKVTMVTNWFAEPEHGGQYAALAKGFFEEAGLDMTIQSGGPQISSTQIVSSGQAMFGMTQADDLLMARKEGIPIVAIAAIFQKNPQGLIYHKEQNITDFSQLNGRKVYVATAASYWEYIKKKYNLDDVQEMKYTGSLANFVEDPTSLTQGYITSEPFALKQQGIETGMLLNADSGYNPYANMLFTTEQTIKEQPELVKAFVEASVKGWNYYKDNYTEINPAIQERNPDMSLEQMEYGAQAQKDFIYGGDAAANGVGYMTEERWNTLMDQMIEIGLLDQKEEVGKVFTNEFLPAK